MSGRFVGIYDIVIIEGFVVAILHPDKQQGRGIGIGNVVCYCGVNSKEGL
tara:strand:+ start:437 stop:586 length:150 start_codon:yes stop_codon:yes gene_type:complete